VYAKTEKRHEEEGERTREKERVVAYTVSDNYCRSFSLTITWRLLDAK